MVRHSDPPGGGFPFADIERARSLKRLSRIKAWLRPGEEDAMSETLAAYLMGPAVMLVIAVAIWGASHHSGSDFDERFARWVDEHPMRWLHHRH
jgi:hypothetical protein